MNDSRRWSPSRLLVDENFPLVSERRRELGQLGEDRAASLLLTKGWEILARNIRLDSGELDLIGRDGDTLVFVEVKTLRSTSGRARPGPERAALAVDRRKQMKVRRLAAQWLSAGEIPPGISEFRFDVVGVEMDPLDPGCEPRIEHIEDAFQSWSGG